ncbi:rhodanese-like domain-containing protein [uncultured Tenacibaculum sp.]|uniref:rhodanese-like domain-containing protein n=1 Tax=uncultured Tenacibaculum sp. TaxID=174713 RepID=UPI0026162986|nr:rhodanese-like domain-containing protein [uncultured Tenacibaculum sp.]
MKKYVVIIICILAVAVSCTSKHQGIKEISVEDLQVVLKNDANIQLVDVRTPPEWAKGTIKNATEINVTSDGFKAEALKKLDKTKPVYLYCRSGGRSKIASEILLKEGFQPYNILGGYLEWQEKNK